MWRSPASCCRPGSGTTKSAALFFYSYAMNAAAACLLDAFPIVRDQVIKVPGRYCSQGDIFNLSTSQPLNRFDTP